MAYSVKEIFYTLQGEGAHTGRPSVFLRFTGCNLWSGREADRSTAVCKFCDTDFIGTDGPRGGQFETPAELAAAVADLWPGNGGRPFVVCTGGEPLLQLDAALIDELHRRSFEIAIETNGTRDVPAGIDWICMSPKAGATLVLHRGDELKFVFPQADIAPTEVEQLDFRHFYLQPMDGPQREANTQLALQYCLKHPQWKLSLQTHKLLGIP